MTIREDSAPARLMDEFRAEALARGAALPAEPEACLVFGDLEWEPNGGGTEEFWAARERDPAFTVTGYSRWVALARILGEIRFYAAPIPAGAPAWYRSGEDAARAVAVDAEPDESELAVLPGVSEAVTLTLDYLAGTPLRAVRVPRTPPPWLTR